MKNSPLIITIVVMVLIGWLIYDNYSRSGTQAPTPAPAPAITKPAK